MAKRFKISDIKTPNAARLLKLLRGQPDHNERMACAYGVHDFAEHGIYKVCQRKSCGASYVIAEKLAELQSEVSRG